MNLEKNILNKIKTQKIKPRAKWLFSLKNIIAWLLGIISLIISSLSMSVIIHIINNNNYLFFRVNHQHQHYSMQLILKSIPYLWLISLIIFIIIFRYTLKQTKDGYKIEISKIIIISAGLSIILGYLFYIQGIGTNIDNSFSHKSHLYRNIMRPCHMKQMPKMK